MTPHYLPQCLHEWKHNDPFRKIKIMLHICMNQKLCFAQSTKIWNFHYLPLQCTDSKTMFWLNYKRKLKLAFWPRHDWYCWRSRKTHDSEISVLKRSRKTHYSKTWFLSEPEPALHNYCYRTAVYKTVIVLVSIHSVTHRRKIRSWFWSLKF
jgi:hypothetical protein